MANNAISALKGGNPPHIPSINTSKDPGKDFYKYINGEWQKHVHIPAYVSAYGVSEEIEADLREKLLAEVMDLRRKKPNDPLSLLASSFLNPSVQKNSIVDLQRISNTFECFSSVSDVCHSIGALNKIQSHTPLSCVVASDSTQSSKCVIYLYEPKLGLPEKKYYKEDSNVFKKYKKMLNLLGTSMNIEGLEKASDIELVIAPYVSGEEHHRTISYIPVSFHELKAKYPAVDWSELMRGWGCKTNLCEKSTFIITNEKYMSLLNHMCMSFELEAWRTWMRALLVISYLEYLPPPFDDLHYELFGKMLKGSTEKMPQKWVTLKVLETFTKQDLSRLYVDTLVPSGTKEAADALIHKLKHATVLRLHAVTWMDDSTRATAIQKVQKMLFQVAYPGRWHSETDGLKMDAERPFMNIINLVTKDSALMIQDLAGHCGRQHSMWEDGAFAVNAYYYSEGNRMTIPAGMLQPPFFDLKRSAAWNYGGIGAAIGHEITHGFDDEGRLYDPEGNYSNWWTEKDATMFEQMSTAVVKLFDGAVYMGGKVDGKHTLSENIADLGGLAIALTALNAELKKAGEEEKKKAYKDFFSSYAVSWRNKDRPRKAKQALVLDVHSPAPVRVNLIVRNFQEFFDAFDIKEGDAGWVPVAERVKLW